METKICSEIAGCGKELLLSAYHRDKYAKDGLRHICKECASNRNEKWRYKNKEYIKKRDAERYLKNKDEINARSKAFFEANPNYHQEWYQLNREKHLQRSADWSKNNLDKKLAAALRRKAIKLNQMGNCPNNYWEILLDYYGKRCMNYDCTKEINEKNKLTLDHVVPLHLGGLHDMKNFQILCLSCNCSKGKKNIDYRNGKIYEVFL